MHKKITPKNLKKIPVDR